MYKIYVALTDEYFDKDSVASIETPAKEGFAEFIGIRKDSLFPRTKTCPLDAFKVVESVTPWLDRGLRESPILMHPDTWKMTMENK